MKIKDRIKPTDEEYLESHIQRVIQERAKIKSAQEVPDVDSLRKYLYGRYQEFKNE